MRADSDERLVVVVVHLGEVAQVRFGEPFDRVQEAAIARFGAEPLESSEEHPPVPGLDRPHVDHSAVG
jgi:hypothetical protein